MAGVKKFGGDGKDTLAYVEKHRAKLEDKWGEFKAEIIVMSDIVLIKTVAGKTYVCTPNRMTGKYMFDYVGKVVKQTGIDCNTASV